VALLVRRRRGRVRSVVTAAGLNVANVLAMLAVPFAEAIAAAGR